MHMYVHKYPHDQELQMHICTYVRTYVRTYVAGPIRMLYITHKQYIETIAFFSSSLIYSSSCWWIHPV